MIKNSTLNVLVDLQGQPYKFYRGKQYTFSKGCFFCSCFDIAKSNCFPNIQPIMETEIAVKNPLVIDATTADGYSYYNSISIYDCILCPESKRKKLINHLAKCGSTKFLSTDEILKWAMEDKDIDAIIIKNVREGNNNNFPIYDVIVWNENNLQNTKDVTNERQSFELFRQNTYKRIDLTSYIPEKEEDGVVNVTVAVDYKIIHKMQIKNDKWTLEHVLIIHTDLPIEISILNTNALYLNAKQMAPGIYDYCGDVEYKKSFLPYNGLIKIVNVPEVYKYKIIK